MLSRRAYAAYLQSPYWRLHARRQALHRAGHRCQDCGFPRALEVHHLTYVRLGCERPEDLLALCAECHGNRHGLLRYARLTSAPERVADILPRVLALLAAT
jgi:5-methylcytosine-specific restriction endonuclease McrA